MRIQIEEEEKEKLQKLQQEEEELPLQKRKKRKIKGNSRLSFAEYLENGSEEEDEENKSSGPTNLLHGKLGNDPIIGTSFLPDSEREAEEQAERERLKKQWLREQEQIKNEPLEITYNYWDRTGHRRVIQVRKGDTIGDFLRAVQQQLAPEFREIRTASVENLLYVKEDIVIPHQHSFYELITAKARGKSGPLFHFDVHEDVRKIADVTIEKDESHVGKVVERHRYEKNKHIFPASRWEDSLGICKTLRIQQRTGLIKTHGIMAVHPNWSELAPICLQLIFELLGFADFHRAKTVCSSWYSASKSCLPRGNRFPWLIRFPRGNTESTVLFNPEEDKSYIMGDLGDDFRRSKFMASSGSWLLMLGPGPVFYILNPFTRERIYLPPLIYGSVERGVLWFDERTKDYIVVYTARFMAMAYCKEGDNMWREIPISGLPFHLNGCKDMVFNKHKLYVRTLLGGCIRIFDFSGVLATEVTPYLNPCDINDLDRGPGNRSRKSIAVTMSGDVLTVVSFIKDTVIQRLYIYKMNPEGSKWERVSCLDGEMLILDLGVTVPTNSGEKCVYFSTKDADDWYSKASLIRQNMAGVFNLTTQTIEWSWHFAPLSGDPRWFFPKLL